MLDQLYLDELKEIEAEKGKMEAKQTLIDFALSNYGIELKRVKRSLSFLIDECNEKIAKLKAEADAVPMPDDNNGLTIGDLILADDEINGKNVMAETPDPEALDLMKTANGVDMENTTENYIPSNDDVDVTVKTVQFKDGENGESVLEVKNETVEQSTETIEKHVETVAETIPEPTNEFFQLPPTFSPTLAKIGPNGGYCTVPWWIYEWIEKNPLTWKSNPDSCPQYHAISTIKSLIYYIKRDGVVKIRETKNSRFIDLK